MTKKVMVESANFNALFAYIYMQTGNWVRKTRTVEFDDDYAVVIELGNETDYDKIMNWILTNSRS